MKDGFRVYVVDTEEVIALTVANILKQYGFLTAAFTNPFDVLESADANSPDLLIANVMMPHLSGVDLAIRLKVKLPECKILLFSGQAATTDILTSARNQRYDFNLLSKLVRPTDRLNKLRNYI